MDEQSRQAERGVLPGAGSGSGLEGRRGPLRVAAAGPRRVLQLRQLERRRGTHRRPDQQVQHRQAEQRSLALLDARIALAV